MKRLLSVLLLIAILTLPFTSCTPTEEIESTKAPGTETEAQTKPTETPTESTEVSTEPTEAPTEPTETPTESTEAPTDGTEAPTEPTEAPTESTEVPTDSTGNDGTTDDPNAAYVFVEGTKLVKPLNQFRFLVDPDAKEITLPCPWDNTVKPVHRISYESNEERDVYLCSKCRAHVTPCEAHGDVEITFSFTKLDVNNSPPPDYTREYEFVIPCQGDFKKELAFTCDGKEYVLPYSYSEISQDGFVWDIYGSPPAKMNVRLCRQTSAFYIDNFSAGTLLRHPDDVTDWDSLVAWVTTVLENAIGNLSLQEYELTVYDEGGYMDQLDFSSHEASKLPISLYFRRIVGGMSTNEYVSVMVNTHGDIIRMENYIHGADWSTVTTEIIEKYKDHYHEIDGNSVYDPRLFVTAQGIKVVFRQYSDHNYFDLYLEP